MVNHSLPEGNGFKLMVPVKRRRATLASDPSRNSRPELIADDGQGVFFPACPIPWQLPDRKAVHAPGVKSRNDCGYRPAPEGSAWPFERMFPVLFRAEPHTLTNGAGASLAGT